MLKSRKGIDFMTSNSWYMYLFLHGVLELVLYKKLVILISHSGCYISFHKWNLFLLNVHLTQEELLKKKKKLQELSCGTVTRVKDPVLSLQWLGLLSGAGVDSWLGESCRLQVWAKTKVRVLGLIFF